MGCCHKLEAGREGWARPEGHLYLGSAGWIYPVSGATLGIQVGVLWSVWEL